MSTSPTLETADLQHRTPAGGFGLTALGALYTLTLRQHVHGRRWLVLGGLFLLPALLAALVRATAPNVQQVEQEFLFVFMFIPQALLPLLALLYASGIINDEQEDQTFTYILVRPIPKWAIYLVKVLATLTTTVLLTAVFTALTYVVIYAGTDTPVGDVSLRCLKAIGVHCLAVVAYCCLFGVLSLMTRWALVLGFLYAAFFEGLLANLPFSIRLLTIIFYTRLIAYRLLDFVLPTVQGRPIQNMAAAKWQLNVDTNQALDGYPTLATCLTVLLVGSFLCTALGAFLCARREFHVKTPEGS